MMMLAEIDEPKLLQIEEFINKNRGLLTTLKCCYSDIYRNQKVFSFLPGHRAIILNIKSTILRLKEAEKSEVEPNVSEEQPPNKMCRKEVQDDNVPKKQLIASLSSYPAKKLGLNLGAGVISERNIHDYKVDLKGNQKIYSCVFSCPFCPAAIPVKRDPFWKSSNVTTHIKLHIQKYQAQGSTNMNMENVIVEEHSIE